MGVFKPDKDTTKCRTVCMSNLKENIPSRKLTVSHNQVIHAGPSLNENLASSLLNLSFDLNYCALI